MGSAGTTGIEKSFQSITSTLKGGIASFDSSFDSRSAANRKSLQSRSSSSSSSSSSSTFMNESTKKSNHRHSSVVGPSTTERKRQSLRQMKATLRQEKIRNSLSFESREYKLSPRGGMESVPSFERGHPVESVATNSVVESSSVTELRVSGSRESSDLSGSTTTAGAASAAAGCGFKNVMGYNEQQGRESECAVSEVGGVEESVFVNRESFDTFRSHNHDTSTIGNSVGHTTVTNTSTTIPNNDSSCNNNDTSKRGSAGLYTANLQKGHDSSLETFKKTSKAVSKKMSQASFGKIRDILANGEQHGHNTTTTTTTLNPHRTTTTSSTNNNNNNGTKYGGGTTSFIGGYRESGIGLGGMLYNRSNSTDEEMSFFVSDGDGKVSKEKVPLVDDEMTNNNNNGVLLLLENGGGSQDHYHLGETMNVMRKKGGEEKKPTVSFHQQQQQQRSVFRTNKVEKENPMTTAAPQSPIPPSGNTPPLVRSVKKATKAVSHSMKHEVVPATRAMAALTAKFVERGEKRMKDGVAPRLRAVASNIDSRLHHHHHSNSNDDDAKDCDDGFVGLQYIEGKGDYVCDPNYHVVRTPQNNGMNHHPRRAYGPNAVHTFDPNIPACLAGAMTAGTMFNYDVSHPEHPEYLPEGIPRVLEVPEDWEVRAGFVPAATLVRTMTGPVDLDDEIVDDNNEGGERAEEEMLALQQQSVPMTKVVEEEVEEEEVTDDDEDARNASMWVACNPEEDMEEEDEFMNVGDIIVATGEEEFVSDDKEFSPRSLETGESGTYHLGDLSVEIKSDDGEEANEETALVTFQQDQQEEPVETFEDDDYKSDDDVIDTLPVENTEKTPMKKVTYDDDANLRIGEIPSQQQQQQLTDKKKEFQTPFSVKKGERPLTFDEFKAINRRMLFDNEEQAGRTQILSTAAIARNVETEDEPQLTVENFVSASSRLDQPSGHRHRELKGRVVLIRIKKKISKAVKKAMKQLLLTAKVGKSKSSSNKSLSDANIVITFPKADDSADVPDSPSAVSIASNLLSVAFSESSKRVIGAAPVHSNLHGDPEYLYGAVNYHNRSAEDVLDDESQQLPPPPKMTPNEVYDNDDEDVVSFLADAMNQGMNIDEVLAIEDGKEVVEEEEQMFLVLTPSEGGDEKVTQVISGNVDGTPVVFNEIMHQNEEGSEMKPHNLSVMFDSGKKGGKNSSIQILDAAEVSGNVVLTPTESNQNVSNVFRRASTGEASASIAQGSTFESEDETLVTHDGNTLVQSDTKYSHDHTITTPTSLKEEEEKHVSTFEIAPEKSTGNSPVRPAYSYEAASNASFLFSPNNMGRADPKIRAKERAMMRSDSFGGSITMLPAAPSTDKSEQRLALKPKPSYSFDYSVNGDVRRDSISSKVSFERAETPSTVAIAVQKKPVMASMTKDRQFSFQTVLKRFSTDVMGQNVEFEEGEDQSNFLSPGMEYTSNESQSKTPVVTNATRKKYAATPYTTAADTSPSKSPSTSSLASRSRRKSSPKGKIVPKSASRTRTSLVKDRISMFQQRIDKPTSVTGFNGRLKKNHSYRFKNERRLTNGRGALAPQKAVLRSTAFIRTVPIGISTSYSRDDASVEESPDREQTAVKKSYMESGNFGTDDDRNEQRNSYAKHYMNTSKVEEKTESFGRSSLDSSAYLSEATECDAFNSLLGKFDADDSSVESDSSDETLITEQKENFSMSPKENVFPSTFKKETLVKPNEINHTRTPLTPQKWRSLAATHGKSSKRLVKKN